MRCLVLNETDLSALAKTLKQPLGVGGTVKVDAIELQTQEREKIAESLRKKSYKVKVAGGQNKRTCLVSTFARGLKFGKRRV